MVWGSRWSNDLPVNNTTVREGTTHCFNRPVASQACLLALALANHCPPSPIANLYKEALYNCQGRLSLSVILFFILRLKLYIFILDIQQAGALGVDFGILYNALGQSAAAEHVTLLLYLLLHKNLAFRSHLLARSDLHTLVC